VQSQDYPRAVWAPDLAPVFAATHHLSLVRYFPHSVLVDGEVRGGRRQRPERGSVVVEASLSRDLPGTGKDGLDRAAGEYGGFLGNPVTLTTPGVL
jgi:hypothetical protein